MKQKKNICFVTDAGPKKFLGYGHLFRCIKIAKFLEGEYNVYFNTKSKISKQIIQEKKLKYTSKGVFDFILCDLPNSNNEKFKKVYSKKIIIIDEFNNYKKKAYKIFNSIKIQKFLFLKFANTITRQSKAIKRKKIKYFVSFGGNDYYNLSKKMFFYFQKNKIKNFKFARYFNKKSYIPKNQTLMNYDKIFTNYKVLFFIGSGGNTMFEMLSNNIPCLIIPTNEIEKKYVNYLKKKYKIDLFKFNVDLKEQFDIINSKKKIKLNINEIKKKYKTLFK